MIHCYIFPVFFACCLNGISTIESKLKPTTPNFHSIQNSIMTKKPRIPTTIHKFTTYKPTFFRTSSNQTSSSSVLLQKLHSATVSPRLSDTSLYTFNHTTVQNQYNATFYRYMKSHVTNNLHQNASNVQNISQFRENWTFTGKYEHSSRSSYNNNQSSYFDKSKRNSMKGDFLNNSMDHVLDPSPNKPKTTDSTTKQNQRISTKRKQTNSNNTNHQVHAHQPSLTASPKFKHVRPYQEDVAIETGVTMAMHTVAMETETMGTTLDEETWGEMLYNAWCDVFGLKIYHILCRLNTFHRKSNLLDCLTMMCFCVECHTLLPHAYALRHSLQ